jgi:hypothetical protein
MVRFRNADNTITLFQFGTKEKIYDKGSLDFRYTVRLKRNKRRNSLDIIHKRGVDNRLISFAATLFGDNRDTNLATLEALFTNQTTIFLDTEGIMDSLNGKYDFDGPVEGKLDEGFRTIKVKVKLIENVN